MQNPAERAIHAFKSCFTFVIDRVDQEFPQDAWDCLMPQTNMTLNLLRPCNLNPAHSAHSHIHGTFDCNAHSPVLIKSRLPTNQVRHCLQTGSIWDEELHQWMSHRDFANHPTQRSEPDGHKQGLMSLQDWLKDMTTLEDLMQCTSSSGVNHRKGNKLHAPGVKQTVNQRKMNHGSPASPVGRQT